MCMASDYWLCMYCVVLSGQECVHILYTAESLSMHLDMCMLKAIPEGALGEIFPLVALNG